MKKGAQKTVTVNRAPVLTLWAAVVAEALGHDREAALTLGKAVAGMNAVSKGRRLGVIEPASKEKAADKATKPRPRGQKQIELLGRRVAAIQTAAGLRAVKDGTPENPAAVERYLAAKLGAALPAVREAMTALAASMPKAELAHQAYALYEELRPRIPPGEKGWGAKGILDLEAIRKRARIRSA